MIPTKSSPKELKFGREGVGKVRESKLEEGKATGFNMHVCCGKFQINGILFYSSLNIERICFKENHHVNSLDLNGSKIHAIYLVELQKIYEMMA